MKVIVGATGTKGTVLDTDTGIGKIAGIGQWHLDHAEDGAGIVLVDDRASSRIRLR